MGTNLQRELMPLLDKLQSAADALYDSVVMNEGINWDDPVEVDRADKAHAEFDAEMTLLRIRFLSYLTLDMPDPAQVADLFEQPGDRWETPNGSSVYCNLAQASDNVNDVALQVHADDWTDHWKHPGDPSVTAWQGTAASAFESGFLTPFKDTAVAQALASKEFGIAAKALDTGVERAKQAVLGLCRLAIERFGGASTGFEPHITPGIAAILADTVSLFSAEKIVDALAAAVGITGGLITEAGDAGAESGGEVNESPIDIAYAPTARELIPEVYRALTELDARIAELDDQVNRGLEKDFDDHGPFGSDKARMPDPNLDPSAYHQLRNQPRAGDPEDMVVVDVVKLYYAGYRSLPQAAEFYDLSVKICGSAYLANPQEYFPRSVAKFNKAVELFSGLLASVRDALTRSGAAMVAAAKDYEYADTTDAAKIKQCIADIPPPPEDRPGYDGLHGPRGEYAGLV